ncbi:Alpha-1-antichymotrypsin [Cichlidogyrus casuarinus]|uniref:Alpha-1-antichymotrypsin n=1 Tax=Cichlidogyrus casuarinus TaxID=1844966 RepID=A0ABD2PI66_9PLAT
MKKKLVGVGIDKAFDYSADFSNVTKKRVNLSDVYHKAVLRVEENGTGGITGSSIRSQPSSAASTSVTFDRPFFVAVLYGDDEMPLLMGDVCEIKDPGDFQPY